MATTRKLKSWKYKKDWPIIREVLKGDRIKFKVDTTTKLDKRYQPVFPTKEEAEIMCEQFRVRLKNEGMRAFDLSPQEREDALEALGMIQALGFTTLVEAVGTLSKYHKPPSGDITIRKLREEFLDHYNNQVDDGVISERTYSDVKSRTKILEKPFGKLEAKFLTYDKLWPEIMRLKKSTPWSRQTLQNYCRVLTRFFNFAVEKGYMAENPMLSNNVSFDKKEATKQTAKAKPSLVNAADAADILREAAVLDKEAHILAFTTLAMFCGLRPEAEILKLDWEDIDLETGRVFVQPNKSKNTASGRIVGIPDCAKEWLVKCDQNKPIAPFRWQYNWKRLRDNAGIIDWKPDTLRHSFASYSYAIHGDRPRLESELGHVDKQMLTHYLQVSPAVNKNAKKYFGLTPGKVLGEEETKVVDFKEAAG